MNQVNRSFQLTRLMPTVTEESLRGLLDGLNEDGENVFDESTRIMVFPKGEYNTTVNAIVTGINMSIREIEDRLRGHLLERGQFYIRGPNYGVQADPSGNILRNRYQTHARLLEANGFLRPVDIFKDSFLQEYGQYKDLKNVTHINGTRQLWRLSNTNRHVDEIYEHGLLKSGSTVNPYLHDYNHLNRGNGWSDYDCTEAWFPTRMETLQTITHFNNNPALMSNLNVDRILPKFITGPPPAMLCGFDNPGHNLGVNNRMIHPHEYPYFCVPRRDLGDDVDDVKFRSFDFQCPVCLGTVTVEKVEGDLNWLSGTCTCSIEDLKDRGLIHGEEPFMRVAKHPLNQHKPLALMQALMPTYSSVAECEAREVPAVIEEFRLGRKELAEESARFFFHDHHYRETAMIKRRRKDIYVGHAFVPRTRVWCPAGLSAIGKATFGRVLVGDGRPLDMPFRGRICEIANIPGNDDHVEIWFEFYLPEGTRFNGRGMFQVIPRPPEGMTNQTIKTFSRWRENDRLSKDVFADFHGLISNNRNIGRWSRTGEDVWIVDFKLASSPTTESIVQHLKYGYIGMDTSISCRENGQEKTYHDFARVISIDDDGWNATFTITFPLRQSITFDEGAPFSCKLWAYDKLPEEKQDMEKNKRKEEEENNWIPAGMEDEELDLQENTEEERRQQLLDDAVRGGNIRALIEIDDNFEMMEAAANDDDSGGDANDDDDDDDDVLRDDEDIIQQRRRARAAQQDREPHPPTSEDIAASKSYCLSLNLPDTPLAITVNDPADRIMSYRKGSLIPDVSFGNLLLHDQQITALNCLRTPRIPRNIPGNAIDNLRARLNDSQRIAIQNILDNRASIIHGPPGTGKTMTVAIGVCLLHCTEEGYLIVTAPSNSAADILLDRILAESTALGLDMNVLRVLAYSKEREYTVDRPNSDHFLHIALEQDPAYMEFRRNQEAAEAAAAAANNRVDGVEGEVGGNMEHGGVHQNRAKKINERLAKMYYGSRLLTRADIIICTVNMATDHRLVSMQRKLIHTDRKLIAIFCDEASMLTSSSSVPLLALGGRRVILAGDNFQLSPVVRNPAAQIACYDMSWMEKFAMTDYVKDNNLYTLLTTQYRSEIVIGDIASWYMYNGEVLPSDEVRERSVPGGLYSRMRRQLNLPELMRGNNVVYTYTRRSEEQEPGTFTKRNYSEVRIIVQLLRHLRNRGIAAHRISIIAMYEGQVSAIRRELATHPENHLFQGVVLSSIDGSQGLENDYVIISMVRSNDESRVGFLRNMNRVNVAITRARHFQFFVCDMHTMMNSRENSIRELIRRWRHHDISVVINRINEVNQVDRLYDTAISTYLAANR